MGISILINGRNISYHRNNKTIVFKFYTAWCDQKQRCCNPKSSRFKTYGAKKIELEYSFLELWDWIKKQNKTEDELRILTIGRIGHDKNYSINNIQLQSRSENSKERYNRCGNPTPPKEVMIFDFKTKKDLCIAKSLHEASYLTSVSVQSISDIISRRPQAYWQKKTGKKYYHLSAKGYGFRLTRIR